VRALVLAFTSTKYLPEIGPLIAHHQGEVLVSEPPPVPEARIDFFGDPITTDEEIFIVARDVEDQSAMGYCVGVLHRICKI